MLNRLHVEKNNPLKLSELPVLYDWLMPDVNLPLYTEFKGKEGLPKFIPDQRPRVIFQNPVTAPRPQSGFCHGDKKLFEGSLTGQLKQALQGASPQLRMAGAG